MRTSLRRSMVAAMLTEILSSYDWYDHPEGPKFVETHRDEHRTSGHWLFLPGIFSTFHRWAGGDELWLIHEGKLHLHIIDPSGAYELVRLGVDVGSGERPVASVSEDCWQAAEVPEGVAFAFGTNVCAPPFLFEQLVAADSEALRKEFPRHAQLIERLTR